jgi:hypothetical protein
MKGYLLFWLTFISLIGTFALAFFKDVDVGLLVPAILGIYATHSFGKAASAHLNARADADADVEKVVEMTNDR